MLPEEFRPETPADEADRRIPSISVKRTEIIAWTNYTPKLTQSRLFSPEYDGEAGIVAERRTPAGIPNQPRPAPRDR
jgi:hypothetical protein